MESIIIFRSLPFVISSFFSLYRLVCYPYRDRTRAFRQFYDKAIRIFWNEPSSRFPGVSISSFYWPTASHHGIFYFSLRRKRSHKSNSIISSDDSKQWIISLFRSMKNAEIEKKPWQINFHLKKKHDFWSQWNRKFSNKIDIFCDHVEIVLIEIGLFSFWPFDFIFYVPSFLRLPQIQINNFVNRFNCLMMIWYSFVILICQWHANMACSWIRASFIPLINHKRWKRDSTMEFHRRILNWPFEMNLQFFWIIDSLWIIL